MVPAVNCYLATSVARDGHLIKATRRSSKQFTNHMVRGRKDNGMEWQVCYVLFGLVRILTHGHVCTVKKSECMSGMLHSVTQSARSD